MVKRGGGYHRTWRGNDRAGWLAEHGEKEQGKVGARGTQASSLCKIMVTRTD